ncbi:RNase adapter RapZ [Psychrobacillus sp. FSL K6-2836]|uniref:RNase adapter RapZ n=1 Tax=Psychrobacillus sp. FSL K6-2836 TaxID=2921548 RepID=UPI0030F81A49
MDSLQKHETEVVIITGMSGAGKTVAIQSFEDLGYYCIDNLPPELLSTFIKLMIDSNKQPRNIAVVMDLRGGEMFNCLADSVNDLEAATTVTPKLLFLDAGDEVLVRRYKETRRSHPLANSGLPLEGIKKERQMLSDLKGRAQYIYNTSKMKPRELREKIQEEFSSKGSQVFTVNVMSFGFKHGIPIDADLVFDVRFLPNPYYIEELRLKSGLNEEVSSYVLKWGDTKTLIEKLTDLFHFMIPQYKREGKTQLVIAFGCTGGQHRSVTLAEYFGKSLKADDKTIITHRDVVIRKE